MVAEMLMSRFGCRLGGCPCVVSLGATGGCPWGAWLGRWLEQLQINAHDISYRLTLATRCHLYAHSQNPLQQIERELVNDLHAGLLKNLAAPKGRAKKRQPVNPAIEQSTLSQQKLFTCEVHVRWDDAGNGEKRRNQALIGVLKAMWLAWRLRDAL